MKFHQEVMEIVSYDTWKTHNSRMHNKKKESELTHANKGEMFESDVEEDVELDNNKHVYNDFKFKIFVAKKVMCLESKKKISKCVINEIVDFAANIASAALKKHNVVDDQVASITQTFGSKQKSLSSMKKTVHLSNQKKLY